MAQNPRGSWRSMLVRYGPLEVASMVAAMIAAVIAWRVTGSRMTAAMAGTIGEGVGFYGLALVRQGHVHLRHIAIRGRVPVHFRQPDDHHLRGEKERLVIASFALALSVRRWTRAGSRTVRDVVTEFGPAEVLDSFVVRPGFMYLFPLIAGQFSFGIILGKIAADVIFYTVADLSVQMRNRVLASRSPILMRTMS